GGGVGWRGPPVFAHRAFGDIGVVTGRDGGRGGGPPPPPIDERHVDWINDAGKPLCLALPPRVAARTAMEAAVAADDRVAALTEAQLEANAKAGSPISVLRAEHRREHLDEIEHALAGGKA